MIKDFFRGMDYFLQGMSLIRRSGIKRYIIVPIIINIIIFVGLLYISKHFFSYFVNWTESFLPTGFHWLAFLLWIFFIVGFILSFFYFFAFFTNIIAAPFNSILSEKIEYYLTGVETPQVDFLQQIKFIFLSITRQFAILAYYLPLALISFLLFFIPVIQIFAPFLWFLFNAWWMAFIYIDYPTDNHRISIKQVRSWLQQRRFKTFGFGISILFFTTIPFLNILTMPIAVAGATKWWLEDKVNT